EELPSDPVHEEGWNKHSQNTEHREKTCQNSAAAGFQNSARTRDAWQELRMDVLDFDRCLVHEDTNRKRQSSEGHDVNRLACRPQEEYGSKESKGNVGHND